MREGGRGEKKREKERKGRRYREGGMKEREDIDLERQRVTGSDIHMRSQLE